MVVLLKKYSQQIKDHWGFEVLGLDCHFDEGRYEKNNSKESKFIRNIHCHIQFMNYDFSKKIAPLRHMMTKGTNKHGKTNSLNPHFEQIQTIAFETFKCLGFKQGESKNITNKKHLKKEEFIKQKVADLEKRAFELTKQNNSLIEKFNTEKQMFDKVSLEVSTLKSHLDLLSEQIKHLDSLKHEMLEAIEQSSDMALREFMSKKIPSAIQLTNSKA